MASHALPLLTLLLYYSLQTAGCAGRAAGAGMLYVWEVVGLGVRAALLGLGFGADLSSALALVGGVLGLLVIVVNAIYSVVSIHGIRSQLKSAAEEDKRRDREIAVTLERLQNDTARLQNDTQRLQTQQITLLVQERRLAEHNLKVDTSVEFLHRDDAPARGALTAEAARVAEGFVVMALTMQNIGDSPVDLLACMVAGRELSNAQGTSMGAAGRDVRWEELPHYFWNEPSKADAGQETRSAHVLSAITGRDDIFKGLSTTRNLPYSRYQLIRLDPGETETLNRIDFVTNLPELAERGHVNLVYKIFTVTLGYPLADIARQIDVSPVGPDTSASALALRAQELARPSYHRWARIQRALFLVNRFTFRLALEGRELEEDGQVGTYYSHDPLGRLSEPNAFRCFLLHHWDFNDSGTSAPEDAPDPVGDLRRAARQSGAAFVSTDEAREYVAEHFGIRDPRSNTPEDYVRARDYCRDHLRPLVDAWIKLNDAIHRCYQPDFGFEELIQEPEYRDRWEALKREGYVLTRYPGGVAEPTEAAAIERFNMRSKYVLVSVAAVRAR